MNVLEYTEWDRPKVARLSDSEVKMATRLESALKVEPLPNGRCRIGPKPGFVGSAQLSRDTAIVIRPRFQLEQFSTLLSLAHQDRAFPSFPGISMLGEGDPSAWFFAQFLSEASRLISSGLRRDYVTIEEDRRSPRGRLRFSGRSPSVSGYHSCLLDDFLKDSFPNQLVKGLVQLAKLRCADPVIRGGLSKLLWQLDDVSAVHPTTYALDAVLGKVLYRRYFATLRLGLLLLRNRGTDFQTGKIEVSAFFFRLYDIFELALFNAIRAAAAPRLLASRKPRDISAAVPLKGGPALRISFEPDVGLRAHPSIGIRDTTGVWNLIVDAKYMKPIDFTRFGRAFKNSHIYQIMAYARVFDAPGVLVYPRIDDDIDISYKVSGLSVRILTVDLRSDIRANFALIARRILDFE